MVQGIDKEFDFICPWCSAAGKIQFSAQDVIAGRLIPHTCQQCHESVTLKAKTSLEHGQIEVVGVDDIKKLTPSK